MATTTISQGISNSEPGTGSGRRRPDASGSPSSMRTQRSARTQPASSPRTSTGADEELEPDALLLGVMDLLAHAPAARRGRGGRR